MSVIETGGIDCDIHPSVPNLKALYPYLTDHWRDIIVQRGVHELNSIAYPANSPLTARPDWRVDGIRPGSDLDLLRQHALDPFQTSIAIANCLYGVQLLFSEDMGAGFARAVNDWIAAEWLDKEPQAAGVDRGAGAKSRDGGGRDQPRRAGQAVRPGAAAGDERHAAGQASLLADLRGGPETRPDGRHPCRQRLSPSGDLGRLAILLYRGLCGPGRRRSSRRCRR